MAGPLRAPWWSSWPGSGRGRSPPCCSPISAPRSSSRPAGPLERQCSGVRHHRGRRSIAVDLKHPDGRAVVSRLVERSDACSSRGVDQASPSVSDSGPTIASPATDVALRPDDRLGTGRPTGQHRRARHRLHPACRERSAAARHGERPLPPVNLVGDFGGGGAFLALGIVAATWEAKHSGEGQVVDAAMVDGSAVLTTMMHGLMAQGRWRDEAGVNFADTGSPYYEVYRVRHGRHVGVGGCRGAVLRRAAARAGPRHGSAAQPSRRKQLARPQGSLRRRVPHPHPRRVGDALRRHRRVVAPGCCRSPRRPDIRTTSPAGRSSSTVASSNLRRRLASAAHPTPSAARLLRRARTPSRSSGSSGTGPTTDRPAPRRSRRRGHVRRGTATMKVDATLTKHLEHRSRPPRSSSRPVRRPVARWRRSMTRSCSCSRLPRRPSGSRSARPSPSPSPVPR